VCNVTWKDGSGGRAINLKAYVDPDISPTSGGFLSRRTAKSEVNAARSMSYSLRLVVYELSRRMFFEWKIGVPNPTPLEIDEPETRDPEPEA